MLETIEILNPRIKREVIIYGAGNNCYRTLAVLLKKYHGIKVLCIADKDERKWGKISGIPVISPDKLAGYDKNVPVIISTVKYVRQIYAFLEGLGFSDFLCYEEATITAMNNTRGSVPSAFAPGAIEKIEFVRQHLADELSLSVFNAKLDSLYKGDSTVLHTLITHPQYFPYDIIRFNKGEIFVDCGAYNGMTAVQFALLAGDFDHIYSFEPDFYMFEEIAHDELMQNFPRFECVEAGISDHSGTLTFSFGEGGQSRISESGGVTINVTSLDDFFTDKKAPTFIKMDIEGAEMDALIGAKGIIEKNRPTLAICAYHTKTHIYEIPYWIKSNFPDYEIYMRQHDMIYETVCYAVCNKE
jgi:FkbM family methyltransferase